MSSGLRTALLGCALFFSACSTPAASQTVDRTIGDYGTSHLTVGDANIADVHATATVAVPADSGPYRLRTCVETRRVGQLPASACDEQAGSAELSTQVSASVPRPASADGSYVVAVSVLYRGDDEVATDWPSAQPPAQRRTALTGRDNSHAKPVSDGAPTANPVAYGGIDTYRPGAVCGGDYAEPQAPDPDARPNPFGGAPAYAELQQPAGKPKGAMLLIHGGGFFIHGPGAVTNERGFADFWAGHGWVTLNVTYRPCAKSLDDVVWFYDQLHDRYPGLDVCATGGSVGATLSAYLAAVRPVLYCVIAQSGAYDPAALAGQTPFAPTAEQARFGAAEVSNMWLRAFGDQAATRLDLVRPLARTNTRLLLAAEAEDSLISPQQSAAVVAAREHLNPGAYTDRIELAGGPGATKFIHGTVAAAELDRLDQASLRVADGAGRQPGVGLAVSRGNGSVTLTARGPAGADLDCHLDGRAVPCGRPVTTQAGRHRATATATLWTGRAATTERPVTTAPLTRVLRRDRTLRVTSDGSSFVCRFAGRARRCTGTLERATGPLTVSGTAGPAVDRTPVRIRCVRCGSQRLTVRRAGDALVITIRRADGPAGRRARIVAVGYDRQRP